MDDKGHIRGGAVACFGAALVLLGYDIIPQDVFEPNVPSWMLVVLGFGLALAGVSPFFRTGSPKATRLVGGSCLLMALAFFWVSFFGDPRYMSGGIPFIPKAYNVLLGRFMFGLVGLLWLWMGVSALRYAKHQPEEGVVEIDQ